MKLEAGEYYLLDTKTIIKADVFSTSLFDSMSIGAVAYIPKQLHKHILNEINSYYTDKDFKEVVDSVWGK